MNKWIFLITSQLSSYKQAISTIMRATQKRHCNIFEAPSVHAGHYAVNEMQRLALACCTSTLQLYLCLGGSMKKSMSRLSWMCNPCAPSAPICILVRRMVNMIRGLDFAVIQADRYLQGYTSVQHVYQVPKHCHASLKIVLHVLDESSRRNKS